MHFLYGTQHFQPLFAQQVPGVLGAELPHLPGDPWNVFRVSSCVFSGDFLQMSMASEVRPRCSVNENCLLVMANDILCLDVPQPVHPVPR